MKELPRYILGKVYNNSAYAESLLDGKLYINPLSNFGAGDLWKAKDYTDNNNARKYNKYRDDLNEGLVENINANRCNEASQLITFFADIGGIPRNANSVGAIDSRLLTENISCYSALLFNPENGELCSIDNRMVEFSDQEEGRAIIIFDVQSFIQRIITALTRTVGSLFSVCYGLVDYDYGINENSKPDEFSKEIDYSYQQEFRIAVNFQGDKIAMLNGSNEVAFDSTKGTLVIDIGSIHDIAFSVSVEDYISLNFPEKFMWIKQKRPESICPFYPPIKTEISYLCPIIRTNDSIYIGNHAMFPVNRNVNTYMINRKRAIKTKAYLSEGDGFFLNILDMYFRRNLDICKSKSNHAMLEQMLTGYSQYMILLGINECAGIHVQKKDEYYSLSYEDINIHDIGLVGYANYYEISNNLGKLKPTDFAVLVTLSNQSQFEEYEYNGKKYIRVEVAEHGVLPSGLEVKVGQTIWCEVSKVGFIVPEFD